MLLDRVITFIISFTFMKMHNFAYFVMTEFYYNYHTFQQDFPTEYIIGAMIGIMFFGCIHGNLLGNKM